MKNPLISIKITGKNNGRYDNTIHSFINAKGVIETCTKNEMYKKYGIGVEKLSLVIKKERKSASGWYLYEPNISTKNLRGRNIIYTFSHISGKIECLTQNQLLKKYNLTKSALSCLINGKNKSHKGWSIIREEN